MSQLFDASDDDHPPSAKTAEKETTKVRSDNACSQEHDSQIDIIKIQSEIDHDDTQERANTESYLDTQQVSERSEETIDQEILRNRATRAAAQTGNPKNELPGRIPRQGKQRNNESTLRRFR